MQYQVLTNLLNFFRSQTAQIETPKLIEILTQMSETVSGFISNLKEKIENSTGVTPLPAVGEATVSLKVTGKGDATLSGDTKNLPVGQKIEITITDQEGNSVKTMATVTNKNKFSVATDIKGLVDGPLEVKLISQGPNNQIVQATSSYSKDLVKGELNVSVTDTTDPKKAIISGTSKDVAAGDKISIEIKGADGTVVKTTAVVGPDGRYVTTADLSNMLDGKMKITATASDRNDKSLKAKVDGELDAVDGELSVDATYVKGTTVKISGEATDVAAGKTVSLTITNQAGQKMELSAKVAADGSYQVTKDLKSFADGPLTVVATAKDRNGNTLTAQNEDDAEGSVTVEIVNLQKETISQTAIRGTTSEIAPGEQVTVTVTDEEGNSVKVTATVSADGSFLQTADLRGLVDGTLTVTASATDKGGNVISAGSSIEMDILAGSLKASFGNVTNAKAAEIKGTATDVQAGDQVTLVITDQDGKQVKTSATVNQDGTFSTNADLSALVDGKLSLSASATDRNDKALNAQGNTTLDAVQGKLDVGFGNLADPKAGEIRGTFSDVKPGTLVSIQVTDSEGNVVRTTAIANERGTFSSTADLSGLADGKMTVTATTVDRNGKGLTDTGDAQLDLVKGGIIVDMGPLSDLQSVKISGNTADVRAGATVALIVTDADGSQVKIDAKVQADGSYETAANLSGLKSGPLSVTATATDRNGVSVQATDKETPVIVEPPVEEPPVEIPAMPDRSEDVDAVAGRVNMIDISGLEGVSSVKILSQGEHGQVSVTPENKIAVVLTEDPANTSEMQFSYQITYDDGRTEKVTTNVTPAAGSQKDGWGLGESYMLETDAEGELVLEHGENHRKVYVSEGEHALTKEDIAAMEGTTVAAIDKTYGGWGAWLAKNPEYGATEDMALTTELGMALWNNTTAFKTTSNWLLFERGYEYPAAERLVARGSNGESELHPQVIGAYGEGDDPVIGGMMNAFQNMSSHTVVTGLNLDGGAQALLGTNLLIDDVKIGGMGGNFQNIDGLTVRNSEIVDIVRDAPVNNADTWSPHINRASGIYIANSKGVRLDENLFDHNGWAEGYDYKLAATKPMPPSMYSHNIYIQNNNFDVTLVDNIIMRGASFGAQVRSGGFIEDNVFIDNNAAVNFFGSETVGNYTLMNGNVITSAGHKRVSQAEGALSYGIDDFGKKTALIENIIAHLADPANAAEIAAKTVGHHAVSKNTDRVFDDTIVYKWAPGQKNTKDQNTAGLDAAKMDATTIQQFASQVLGKEGATISDLANLLRAQAHGQLDEVVDADLIIAFFREGFGLDVAVRAESETLVFNPDERGDGVRWDNRLNWSTDDLPGTRDGDSVDLAGNTVYFGSYTVEVDDFDFGDFGRLTATSGKLSITGDITVEDTGAGLKIDRSGQVWVDGYSDEDMLSIDVAGGRFANTGTVTGSTDISVSDNGQAILAMGDANFQLTSGSSLTVTGSRAKVGMDGLKGQSAIITLDEGSTVRTVADANGFTKIGETRSGAVQSDVSSGLVLGGDLDVDVTALASINKNGTYRLFEVDDMVFNFKSVDVEGLDSDTDALVRIDHIRDVIEVVIGNGTGQTSVEYIGQSAYDPNSKEMADIFGDYNPY